MRSGPAGGGGGVPSAKPVNTNHQKVSFIVLNNVSGRFYSNNNNNNDKSRLRFFVVRFFPPACRTSMRLPESERKSEERMEAADGAERDLGMLTHPPGLTFI